MHLFDSFSILKKSSEPMQQPNHDMNPFSFFIYNILFLEFSHECESFSGYFRFLFTLSNGKVPIYRFLSRQVAWELSFIITQT